MSEEDQEMFPCPEGHMILGGKPVRMVAYCHGDGKDGSPSTLSGCPMGVGSPTPLFHMADEVVLSTDQHTASAVIGGNSQAEMLNKYGKQYLGGKPPTNPVSFEVSASN